MASQALREWRGQRAGSLATLDGQCVAAAVAAQPDPVWEDALVRGSVVLVAAHFQGFCRDLYTECVGAAVAGLAPAPQKLFQRQCNARCELAGGNARYENIRADFERFNLDLPAALRAYSPSADAWVTALGHLNAWRNFVAHGSRTTPPHGGPLALPAVRLWLVVCDGMAAALDSVMYHHLHGQLGGPPW